MPILGWNLNHKQVKIIIYDLFLDNECLSIS